MKTIKKIVAAAVAAVSIVAIGATASAETVASLPVSWSALYQHGAPTSINKKFSVTVEQSSTGYKAECTYFSGGDGSVVTLITSNGYSFEYTEEETYIIPSSFGPVNFTFSALGSTTNTNSRGTIKSAK